MLSVELHSRICVETCWKLTITVTITPGLQGALRDYAAIYAKSYGIEEPVADLIPAMLATFMESDRSFIRVREARQADKS